MKDEIKEILQVCVDSLDGSLWIDYIDSENNRHEYSDITSEQLSDYITTLEQENEKLRKKKK